jgi:hypothetical protein
MDELQRQMRQVAAAVAGGARLPGPDAARRRGRELRRRSQGRVAVLAVALIAVLLPATGRLALPGPVGPEQPPAGFPPLTRDHYGNPSGRAYHALGPPRVVDSGEHLGQRWRLVAWWILEDGERMRRICISLDLERDGSTWSCNPENVTLASVGHGFPEASLYAGYASAEAAAVQLDLIEGGTLDARLTPAPAGFQVRFWSAVVAPGDAFVERVARIAALDGRGAVLCEWWLDAAPEPERDDC